MIFKLIHLACIISIRISQNKTKRGFTSICVNTERNPYCHASALCLSVIFKIHNTHGFRIELPFTLNYKNVRDLKGRHQMNIPVNNTSLCSIINTPTIITCQSFQSSLLKKQALGIFCFLHIQRTWNYGCNKICPQMKATVIYQSI